MEKNIKKNAYIDHLAVQWYKYNIVNQLYVNNKQTNEQIILITFQKRGEGGHFPGVSVVKNSPANTGDMHSIPGSERSPGGGNGNPLQYFCLENPMDRGAWWATIHKVTKNRTWLSKWNTHMQEGWEGRIEAKNKTDTCLCSENVLNRSVSTY